MIKGSIHQEVITIINMYAPNQKAQNYVKQKLTELRGEMKNSTLIVGDFSAPLIMTGRTSMLFVRFILDSLRTS